MPIHVQLLYIGMAGTSHLLPHVPEGHQDSIHFHTLPLRHPTRWKAQSGPWYRWKVSQLRSSLQILRRVPPGPEARLELLKFLPLMPRNLPRHRVQHPLWTR